MPGANSITSSEGLMAKRLSIRRVNSMPPGRRTRLPNRASTQWPGIFSVFSPSPGRGCVVECCIVLLNDFCRSVGWSDCCLFSRTLPHQIERKVNERDCAEGKYAVADHPQPAQRLHQVCLHEFRAPRRPIAD